MRKIIHVITNLGSGGAENMLYKLLKYSDKKKYYHEVVSLLDLGTIGPKIEELGVTVHVLNMNKKNLLKSVVQIRKLSKNFDVIDTWLYHSDLIGMLVAKLFYKKRLVWNIRHSNLNRKDNKLTTWAIIKFNSVLSKYVDSITYNSNEAKTNHLLSGYNNKNSVVVYNGFELDQFNYEPHSRKQVRKLLNIDNKATIGITVGRWYKQKDYNTLLKAINELKKTSLNFKMIMCGTNLEKKNIELWNLIQKYKLENDIILLGRREDIPALLSASDIYISSSIGESFSNSIGEAMACELPCIVTDVGESKAIVGETGIVINPKDYINLSKEIVKLANNEERDKMGINARIRIKEKYDIKSIIRLYEKQYEL